MTRLIARIPDANRVAIYLTVIADVIAAVLVITSDLGADGVTAVLVSVAAVNAKVLMFLKGWQSMESADYQAQLMNRQHAAQMEARAAAAEVGRPGSKRSTVALPR